MIQFFKKVYLNKNVFIVLMIGLGYLFPPSILMCAMSGQMSVLFGLIFAVSLMLIISLFWAYRRHDLILMNGLITAIMITEILRYAYVVGAYLQMGTEEIVAMGLMYCLELSLRTFALLIECLVAYNHYTLNTNNQNNQTKIIVNQFALFVLGFVFLGIIVVNWFANTDPWVLLSNTLLYFCDLLIYGSISCCELVLSVDRVDNTMTRGNSNDVKGALWYLVMLLCGLYGLIIAYLLKGLPEIFVLGDFAITAVCAGGLIYYLQRKKVVLTPAFRFGRILMFLISLGAIVSLIGFFMQTVPQFHKEIKPDAVGDIATLNLKAVEKAENSYVFQSGNLYIIFPQYRKIDFAFEDYPSMKKDKNLTFFASGPFFYNEEIDFHHENILGAHAKDGVYYDGESGLDGAFTFYDGKAHLALGNPNEAVKLAAEKGGSGFEQFMAIWNGKDRKVENVKLRCYRVLAELNGRICIIDSVLPTHYEEFIQSVLDLGVKKALYLDMGGKSTHSQYRNNQGKAINLFGVKPGMFVHSWIVFRK